MLGSKELTNLLNEPAFSCGCCKLFLADSLEWLSMQPQNSIHGVVTDPPYGMLEYSPSEIRKLRAGRGGVWRIPPEIGGSKRAPLPRFTVLDSEDREHLADFFAEWASKLWPVLVPGAHVVVASSPLLSHIVSTSVTHAGFEKRGEIVRLVRTLRGGDRPKGAEKEFEDISAMPRSSWEPWLLFRKPLQGTLAENLREWGAGALRRPSPSSPFTDVILSFRTPRKEKQVAPHPSLKPQHFLRQVVSAVLPLGKGTLLDPFAGSGSTLAACQAVGFSGIGVEIDEEYVKLAIQAIPKLAALSSRAPRTTPSNGSDVGRIMVDGVQEKLL